MVFLKCDICKKLALETNTHVREEAVYWSHTCLNPLVPLSPVPTTLRSSTVLLCSNASLVASAAPLVGVTLTIMSRFHSLSAQLLRHKRAGVSPGMFSNTYRPATQTIPRLVVVLMKLVLGNIITQVGYYNCIPYLNVDWRKSSQINYHTLIEKVQKVILNLNSSISQIRTT